MTEGKSFIAWCCEKVLVGGCRFFTGIQARWMFDPVPGKGRIFYANHSSHLDGVVVWSGMPAFLRSKTSLVAARDYWQKNAVRRYLAEDVFHVVLVDRKNKGDYHSDPLAPLAQLLEQGESLIIFPEGTRGQGEELGSFKSGIYHLARRFPDVELVPVYLENLNRVLPRGVSYAVPVLCSATFGPPLEINAETMGKHDFLNYARQTLIDMSL